MASPLASRTNSYTNLAAMAAPKPSVALLQHHHLSAMRRVSSAPNLVKTASHFHMGPAAFQNNSQHQASQETAAIENLLARGAGAPQRRHHLAQSSAQDQQQASECHRAVPMAERGPANNRASAVATDARFASLSRVLLVGQPGSMFRSMANRKWPSAFGPISLLVFLFGTVLALFAAVRGALVRKVKACKCCKGFGVVRCRLCDGRGTVDWRAKFSYSESCPLCAAKRFVVCPDCGGHYHRRLFNHAKGAKGTLESFFPGTGAGVGAGAVTSRD